LPANTFDLTPEYLQPVLEPTGRLIVPAHFNTAAADAPFGWKRDMLSINKTFLIKHNVGMIELFADTSSPLSPTSS